MNHWDPHNGAWWRKKRRAWPARGRRISFLDGMEPGVVYLTVKDLALKADVGLKVIRYALAKKVGEAGYLEAARRQPGRSGVLIHPVEAARWMEERRKKEEKH